MGEVHAKGAMCERGGNGVLKVVDAVAAGFAPVAVVDPRVRVLMHEQRYADGGEVTVAFITITIAPQRVPRSGRNRMRRRSNRQKVKDSVFAVSIPARL